jgi:hypothetical protein
MLAGYTNYFPDFAEGLIHLGEGDPTLHGDYMSFKAGKHQALNRSAGEHFLAYLLGIRALKMRRRYRTEFDGEFQARLTPAPDYREREEHTMRDFSARLVRMGIAAKFPRTPDEVSEMQEAFRRLKNGEYPLF